MTEYRWRPSMFAPAVVHVTEEGQIRYASERYRGSQWVEAVCGQKVAPEGTTSLISIECPECLVWLQENPTVDLR